MRIRVRNISESPEELLFDEPTADLNPTLERGKVFDFRFAGPARVRLTHYRAGRDLFFTGEVVGSVIGQCARCLEDYAFEANAPFALVYVPRDAWRDGADDADGDVAVYDGDEVDLTQPLHEHLLVALPTTPLCGEACRGLCQRCGANLNLEPCTCDRAAGDPRLAVLRSLKLSESKRP